MFLRVIVNSPSQLSLPTAVVLHHYHQHHPHLLLLQHYPLPSATTNAVVTHSLSKCYFSRSIHPGSTVIPPSNASTNRDETGIKVHHLAVRNKQVKEVLLGSSWLCRLASILVALIGSSVLYTYVFNWEETPEKQLDKAINNLNDLSTATKRQGLEILNSTYVTKRVFSGAVGIPLESDLLLTPEVMTQIVANLDSTDREVSFMAFHCLYKELRDHPSKCIPMLLQYDPSLHKTTSALMQKNYDFSYNKQWLLAAQVLFMLNREADDAVAAAPTAAVAAGEGNLRNRIDEAALTRAVEGMVDSREPLAIAVASELYRMIKVNGVEERVVEVINKSSSEINKYLIDSGISRLEYLRTHDHVKAGHTYFHDPAATVISSLLFAGFAAVYSKTMWTVKILLSPSLHRFARTDPDQTKHLKRTFMRQRVAGRTVLALLLFDLLASKLLQYTSGKTLGFTKESPVQLPKKLNEYPIPLSSIFPIVQTTIFTLGTLYLMKKHRHVLLPLLLAGLHYHKEPLERVPVVNEAFHNLFAQEDIYVKKAEDFLTKYNILADPYIFHRPT